MLNSKINVVFMGTPEFAVPSLQSLITQKDFNVLAVITQEDKKVGRKQIITPPPVKQTALQAGITVLQPVKLKGNKEIIQLLKGLELDFIVVVAYGKLLPKEILEIPKYGCINVHASLLPKYRGASPIEESLLHGDNETGISIIQMEERLDCGKIFLMKRLEIENKDNSETLRVKLSLLGASILPEILKEIKENNTQGITQNEKQATYCHKIKKEDGQIDFAKMSAKEIIGKIKAYTPWPSCYVFINKKRLKILEAEIDENVAVDPGKIVERGKNKIGLGTKSGLFLPTKIQLEGKSPMSIETFLAGNRNFFKENF